MQNAVERYQREGVALSPGAAETLGDYHWPGNVRELQHVIERAVLLADEADIHARDLQLSRAALAGTTVESAANLTLEEAERQLIQRALDSHRGQVDKAAKSLGLSRSALYRRLDKHGLSP